MTLVTLYSRSFLQEFFTGLTKILLKIDSQNRSVMLHCTQMFKKQLSQPRYEKHSHLHPAPYCTSAKIVFDLAVLPCQDIHPGTYALRLGERKPISLGFIIDTHQRSLLIIRRLFVNAKLNSVRCLRSTNTIFSEQQKDSRRA